MQRQHDDCICDTLITADVLVTQDEHRRILEDAALAVRDGRILALGSRRDLAVFTAAERLDLGNALVMPGLVNAHTHVAMTFLRGVADDIPLMDWLNRHIFPREQRLTAEIVELGALLGCAEMTRTGTTAFADMYLIEDAVAKAVDLSGLRCLMGEVLFSFSSPAYAGVEEAIALVREQERRYRDHPRLKVAVMPHAVYTTTPEILVRCGELARELGAPLYLHLAETESETEACLSAHGKRPLAYCADLGLLGACTTIAHAVTLNEKELDLLARSKTCVAHNPKSNMKLASGVAPIAGMLARGILPGLGTDGPASNNSLNMFAEMSVCSLLHKVCGGDPTLCPAGTVLDMATLGSARALSWPELGRLCPGAPADLIALDLSSPNLLPLYEPISHLVYAASGQEVTLTMVGGRTLYRDGRYTCLDYPLLRKEALKLKRWVCEHA